MAEKRMFSKKIIDTDWFMDMPATTQNLYFHLSMRADDDGFVASPRRIVKLIGASEDDYKLLIAKKFVITFESGVCVIKDWRINNYLRSDRYTETVYQEEKHLLNVKENGEYEVGIPTGIPEVSTVSYSNSNSISNSNNINNNIFKKPSIEEVREYCKERNNNIKAEEFIDFYESKGWYVGKNKMKDWKASVRLWEQRDKKTQQSKPKLVRKEATDEEKEDYLRVIREREEMFKI